MEFPAQAGPPKFKLFNLSCQRHEFFKVGKYEQKIKFEGTTMVGSPQTRIKLKLFNCPSCRHITISGYANKHEGKIKLDKIWGTKMWSFKVQTFQPFKLDT